MGLSAIREREINLGGRWRKVKMEKCRRKCPPPPRLPKGISISLPFHQSRGRKSIEKCTIVKSAPDEVVKFLAC
jgi:hypothetical protein